MSDRICPTLNAIVRARSWQDSRNGRYEDGEVVMSGGLAVTKSEFENGVLTLRTGGYRARIVWEPSPRAEEEDQHGRWKECWPADRLIVPDASAPSVLQSASDVRCELASGRQSKQIGSGAFAGFRALIPAHLAQFVEPFRSHQWVLLKLLHDVKEMMDWAVENPVLAYCVANNAEFRAISGNAAAIEARRHCMRKQTSILEWLKFPRSPAVVKLLKKILPVAAEPSRLRRLRAAIRGDSAVLESLSRQRQIGVGTIALFVHREIRRLVTQRLLDEVAAKGDERCDAPTADMLVGALQVLSRFPNRVVVRPVSSIMSAKQFHDEALAAAGIMEEEDRALIERRRNPVPAHNLENAEPVRRRNKSATVLRPKGFPLAPPIPGTKSIVPLVTKEELVKEGRAMKNCIATYEPCIRRGSKYAYRVMLPDRATLLIARSGRGRWRREDLRLQANQLPAGEIVKMVDHWLRDWHLRQQSEPVVRKDVTPKELVLQ